MVPLIDFLDNGRVLSFGAFGYRQCLVCLCPSFQLQLLRSFEQFSSGKLRCNKWRNIEDCHQMSPVTILYIFAFRHLTRQDALCHYHALPCNSKIIFNSLNPQKRHPAYRNEKHQSNHCFHCNQHPFIDASIGWSPSERFLLLSLQIKYPNKDGP